MIDNLFYQLSQLEKMSSAGLKYNDYKSGHTHYGVVTLHRPSNVDDKPTLIRIFKTLDQISKKLPLIFPIHPRTQKNMETFGIQPPETITLTPPLSYMAFLNLWKDAKLALTDSGGLQEETTALGIPCLTIRENTERPITITQEQTSLSVHQRIKFLMHLKRSWQATGEPAKNPISGTAEQQIGLRISFYLISNF